MQVNNNKLAPRTAFTMVELVIVIAIIAILMAFLLPAIGGAITTARNATVTSEIANLEKAIAEFKLKYGVEPPSRMFLYEEEAGWDRTDIVTRESKAFIRQCWPNFDFDYSGQSGELDINGNDAIESANDGRIQLNGAECLLFFLGGMCATEDATGTSLRDASGSTMPSGTAGTIAKWFPLGFSTNAASPFVRGGSRVGPFYEFEPSRIKDINGGTLLRAMPEYLDTLPGQTSPYNFASSYGGRGYNVNASFVNTDLDLGASSVTSPTYVYLQSADTTEGTVSAVPFNNKSYQIISPGLDNQYGTGGAYDKDDGFSGFDDVQKDNITNFSGGVLDPS